MRRFLPRIIRLWRLARELEQAADRGDTIIHVPPWLTSELQQIIWQRKIERASERWTSRTAEVSLEDWQRGMIDHATRQESDQGKTEPGTTAEA